MSEKGNTGFKIDVEAARAVPTLSPATSDEDFVARHHEAVRVLTEALGRAPTVKQIAAAVGVNVNSYTNRMGMLKLHSPRKAKVSP